MISYNIVQQDMACNHISTQNETKKVYKPGPLATIFVPSMPISVLAASVSVTFLFSVFHSSVPKSSRPIENQCKSTKHNNNLKEAQLHITFQQI